MSKTVANRTGVQSRTRTLGLTVAATMSLGLGGCAGQAGDMLPQFLAAKERAPAAAPVDTAQAQTELEKATEYWGQEFAKKPHDLHNALSYARNLKAMGQKRQALAALQQAAAYHGQSRELAGEYGRLALDLDQVSTAKPLLAFADDPAKPDWRVVSARGTVLAKEGSYKDAIPYFERAMALSNNNPSVMNNLAIAHALAGEPERSEQLLRQAAGRGGQTKVRQNLALVLGLQGKYDEAKVVGSKDKGLAIAEADTALVRQIVGLDPKAMPVPQAPVQLAATAATGPHAHPAAAGAGAATPIAAAATSTPARPVALRPTAPDMPVASGSWQPKVAANGAAPANAPTAARQPSR